MFSSIKILVTGRFWLGSDGACAIGPALIEMIDSARQEIIIVAYRLTVAHQELRGALEASLARGCIIKIILDKSDENIEIEKSFFSHLMSFYPNLSIWDFKETENYASLHAKLIVVDRRIAVIGSANFSNNGLLENHELAVLIKGSEARSLCAVAESLINEASKAGALIKRTAHG